MRKILAKLSNIEKSYQKKILDITNFNIYQKECTIITGDNGSGKSTFLKIIAGLVCANSGKIEFDGQKFTPKKHNLLAQNSVYLSSKPYLFNFNVEKNIAYPLIVQNNFKYQKKVNEIIKWADLENLRLRAVHTLSSGEIQKIAIARARILNKKVWLLDEPTENLDKNAKKQICNLLQLLLDENKSIIIVTHSEKNFEEIPHTNFHIEKIC